MLVGRLRSCTGFGEMKVGKSTGSRNYKNVWDVVEITFAYTLHCQYFFLYINATTRYVHTFRVILVFVSKIVLEPIFPFRTLPQQCYLKTSNVIGLCSFNCNLYSNEPRRDNANTL